MLLPVLDDAKHYWVAADEVDKLIRAGEGWLAAHPERGLITRRYLGRRWALTRTAFARLAELGDDVEEDLEPPVEEEPSLPRSVPPAADQGTTPGSAAGRDSRLRRARAEPRRTSEVAPRARCRTGAPEGQRRPERGAKRRSNTLRREAVVGALEELGARSVIDLGCGSGQLVGGAARPAGVHQGHRGGRVGAGADDRGQEAQARPDAGQRSGSGWSCSRAR